MLSCPRSEDRGNGGFRWWDEIIQYLICSLTFSTNQFLAKAGSFMLICPRSEDRGNGGFRCWDEIIQYLICSLTFSTNHLFLLKPGRLCSFVPGLKTGAINCPGF
jgi:hypothetical protein